MEAPNSIKFQSVVTAPRAPLSPNSTLFRHILNEAHHTQSLQHADQPPESPKRGLRWLVLDGSRHQTGMVVGDDRTTPMAVKMTHVNGHNDGALSVLSGIRTQPNIRHLIIRHSNLHQHQVDTAARVLALNDGIAWLVLDHNDIDDDTLTTLLSDVHPDNAIQHLVLSDNRITSEGLPTIIRALENMPHLQTLWLDNNEISDDHIESLMVAISRHPSLKTVSIRGNHMSEFTTSAIKTAGNSMTPPCRCYV